MRGKMKNRNPALGVYQAREAVLTFAVGDAPTQELDEESPYPVTLLTLGDLERLKSIGEEPPRITWLSVHADTLAQGVGALFIMSRIYDYEVIADEILSGLTDELVADEVDREFILATHPADHGHILPLWNTDAEELDVMEAYIHVSADREETSLDMARHVLIALQSLEQGGTHFLLDHLIPTSGDVQYRGGSIRE